MLGLNEVNSSAVPDREFIKETMVPAVYEALTEVARRRPVNPIEFVAYYLLAKAPEDEVSEEEEGEVELGGISMTQQSLL